MYKHIIKRLIDIMISILGIPFVIIVIIVLVPIIRLEDNGPVFYISERLGKNKKSFKMYKFRSMKVNSPDIRTKDNETYNAINDSRLTRVGKFIRKYSIDEFPQLFNVLLGDMSLIGPRPNLDDHEGHEFTSDEIRRLEVRPGITGYNQAYYRNSISKEEKFKNDVYYVDHVSFVFDLRILFRTFVSVIKKENIYNS